MDVNSMFGFMDIIVCGCGVYGLYSWYMLVYKHEIKKQLLVGGDTNPEKCKDIEGFAAFMGPKLLILSIAMMIFGAISACNTYLRDVGVLIWIGMAVFLAVIVWYCYHLRKADAIYFDKGNQPGNSIKNKALRK